MVDFKTCGGYDGLHENGVNANQGAESRLSWLLSLLIMYEMQAGDTPQDVAGAAPARVNPA